jgi:hypothetical protein
VGAPLDAAGEVLGQPDRTEPEQEEQQPDQPAQMGLLLQSDEEENVRVNGDTAGDSRQAEMMSEKETRAEEAPDLWTQLEDMLGMVRLAEANWRLDDRIDLAVRNYRSQREAA